MMPTRDLQTLSWYQVIINTNIRVITPMSWLHPSLSFITRLLYLFIITICVIHYLRTQRKPQASYLNKKNYFKINASLGPGVGSMRKSALNQGEVPSIATTKKTTKRSHEWRDKGRWLAERSLAWLFGTSISASTMIYHITCWVEVTAEELP